MDGKQQRPYELIYRLIAQTPMLHFQHEQSGATLRASEVKPKLDRYLRKVCGDEIKKEWQVSKEHPALNYKMQITAGESSEEAGKIRIEECKAFFGNPRNVEPKPKDLVFRHCELKILCFIEPLRKLIDTHIGAFFVLHNFGTRQSKGYGGFLVDTCKDKLAVENIVKQCGFPYCYADITPQMGTDIRQRMNHAHAIYTIMKSGVNLTKYQCDTGRRQNPDRYVRGYIRRAFLPDNVGSDKAFLKAKVVRPNGQERSGDVSYKEYTFIRAMLGLAGYYEFRDDLRNGGPGRTGGFRATRITIAQFKGTKIEGGKLRIPMDSIKNNLGIKRFQSPVLIKVFRDRIYFILNDSQKEILGKVFLLLTKEVNMIKNERPTVERKQEIYQSAHYIKTPETFDAEKFIKGFVEYFNRKETKDRLSSFDDRPRSAGNEFYAVCPAELKAGGCE